MKRWLTIFSVSYIFLHFTNFKALGNENLLLSEGIKTSDIRLELVSEIKTLEEDLKKLKTKLKSTENPEKKKLLRNKIDAIKERLKVLKKQLENYNQHIDTVS